MKRREEPIFLPGKLHRQRRLAGYSPWGHKEPDTTEQLTLYLKARKATFKTLRSLYLVPSLHGK